MDSTIGNEEYSGLLESIRFIYGYDFTDYAESAVRRRIIHFMQHTNIETVDKLGKLLLRDEAFFEEFVQELSVTVTEMFRDPTFYKSLRHKLIKRLATYPVIKIWIAGCATGEEVYSMAILLKEEGLLERSIIYATDINQKSLHIAREGVYPVENMKAYTANYQKAGGTKPFSEYYKAKYNSVMFDKSLKQSIVFAPHNLTTDKSFNEFQMIICRNVLIYFNQQLQNKVINLFYESLCPFGFLGLGTKNRFSFLISKKTFRILTGKKKYL